MTRPRDIFDVLPEDERLELMRQTTLAVLGEQVGARTWERIEPSLRHKLRQVGDHPDPAQNHWKGVWRIYEAE
jgi:hypothetical protein